jgi:hypothetical protein
MGSDRDPGSNPGRRIVIFFSFFHIFHLIMFASLFFLALLIFTWEDEWIELLADVG